jgi:hypothetical protein
MSFWFECPLWLKMLNIFSCIFGHLYFFWTLSIKLICQFINWIVYSFGVGFWALYIHSEY